ncbi:hypothetical protein D3C81_1617210 [compost metagenome]
MIFCGCALAWVASSSKVFHGALADTTMASGAALICVTGMNCLMGSKPGER